MHTDQGACHDADVHTWAHLIIRMVGLAHDNDLMCCGSARVHQHVDAACVWMHTHLNSLNCASWSSYEMPVVLYVCAHMHTDTKTDVNRCSCKHTSICACTCKDAA